MECLHKRLIFPPVGDVEGERGHSEGVCVCYPLGIANTPAKTRLGGDLCVVLKVVDDLVRLQIPVTDVIVVQRPFQVPNAALLGSVLAPSPLQERLPDITEGTHHDEHA
eukprot:CAMPEP_0169466186 /NCGR_PEP_ID=MMETSP1042-20121227/21634_1 /TAXON_ID=464988 /ORGANISM="Hemiselmis andersenii, Strain CCMP1180" /LENGTH=108 /DNA_ID=CAMNT_0009579223 /DNA_START=212 /DNA_END=535 /DNA_ORIENTATION=-